MLLIALIFVFVAFQLRSETSLQSSFSLLAFSVSTYGLIIMIGIAICLFVMSQIRPDELDTLNVIEATVWTIIPAVVFSRAWHVITDFHLYKDNLGEVINISSGGMSVWGALLGGLIGVYIFTLLYGFNFKLGLNTVSIVLPLGQAVGRLGNLINRELFGPPTDRPWGMFIEKAKRPAEYIDSEYFHPAFLYEIIGLLILFIVLLGVSGLSQVKLGKTRGNKYHAWLKNSYIILGLYLLGYGLIRFFVEFYRIEDDFVGFMSLNQVVSLMFVAVGGLYLSNLFFRKS